jgi:hypothetical protein
MSPRGTLALPKHSKFERARRASETARSQEIQDAWRASLPADVAADFDAKVLASKQRAPWTPPPDMAPGTPPRPPRPGREPKPKKDESNSRRRSF